MKKICFFFLLFLSCPFLNAQDPVFSKYYSTPLELNPGFAGSNGRGRLSLGYRDQWPAISGNFMTITGSYDQYFAKLHGGIGVNYYNDRAGDGAFKTNAASAVYAFRMELLDQRLIIQPALSFGFISKSIDTSKLFWGTTPEIFSSTHQTAFDCAAGFVVMTGRFDFGIAAFHLNQPDLGFFGTSKLPIRYNIHASAILGNNSEEFEKKFSVIPQITWQSQSDFNQLNAGASVKYGHWQLGAGYRFDDAVIGMAGFVNHHFRICYSYDYTISEIGNNVTGGSHEITFQLFMFPKNESGPGYSDSGTCAF